MSPDLVFVLSVTTFSLVSAFVAYWHGVNAAEARAKAHIEHLLDELDAATELIRDMLEPAREPHNGGRALRIVKDGL